MNRYTRPDNSSAWILRSEPAPEEFRDWRLDRHGLDTTISFNDLMMVVGGVIFCVTIVLVVGLSVLRSDRPAACAPYPTYAECAAAVAEGSDQ